MSEVEELKINELIDAMHNINPDIIVMIPMNWPEETTPFFAVGQPYQRKAYKTKIGDKHD